MKLNQFKAISMGNDDEDSNDDEGDSSEEDEF